MSEMVKRVALAMQQAAEGPAGDFDVRPHECYVKAAHTAIVAMHDPTDSMCDVGNEILNYPVKNIHAASVWRSMIDAALL